MSFCVHYFFKLWGQHHCTRPFTVNMLYFMIVFGYEMLLGTLLENVDQINNT